MAILLTILLAALAETAHGSRPAVTHPLRDTQVTSVELMTEFPHDPSAWTQGLLVLEDESLWESVGHYGRSELRRVDLPTGRITHRERLPSTYFAEGLAYTDGRLVLLTWREGIAMRFRLPQAELEGAWRYSGEGWGLTPWRNSLAVSNGSPEIVFRDTTDFRVLRSVTVHDNENRITNLNELETLEESLVANVWGTDWLVRFDPETGVVLEWIDLGPLARRQRKLGTEETNGVAWDARQRRLLVTGKLWNRVYQIRLQRPDGSVWP